MNPPNPQNLPEFRVERVPEVVVGRAVPIPRVNAVLLVDDIEQEIRAYTALQFYEINPVIADIDIEVDKFELNPIIFQMLQTESRFMDMHQKILIVTYDFLCK